MPAPAVQLDSRNGTRKRKVQRISISPEPIAEEDIILAGESEDDSDTTRSHKKAKREAYAQHYLDHGWIPIMTASLKGPFGNDWENPWAKVKRHDNMLGHASRISAKTFFFQLREESPSPAPRSVNRATVTSRDVAGVSKRSSPLEHSKAMPSRMKGRPADLQEYSTESKLTNGGPRVHSPASTKSVKLLQETAFRSLPVQIGHEKQFRNHTIGRSSFSAAVTPEHASSNSTTSSSHAPEAKLELEDDLNTTWSRGSSHKKEGLLQTMRWHEVAPKSSGKQGMVPSERVLFYGDRPVLLENGQVNNFGIHHLKAIRAKLSLGISRVKQRFDTFSATRNASDTIVCCDMLSDLAQTLQKVDHVKRLHDSSDEFSGDSSPWLELHAPRSKLQHLPISGILSRMSTGGSSSSEQIIAHKRDSQPQRHKLHKPGSLVASVSQEEKVGQAKTHLNKDNGNDGGANMTDPGVLDLMDISFGSQAAANSAARNSDQNQPATPVDANTFTSNQDHLHQSAFSAKSEKMSLLPLELVDDNLYRADPDELLMGGTVFVGGSSNPFANISSSAMTSSVTSQKHEISIEKPHKVNSEALARKSINPVNPARNPIIKPIQTMPPSAQRPTSAHQSSAVKKTRSSQQSPISQSQKLQVLTRSPQYVQQQRSAIGPHSALKTPTTPRQAPGSAYLSRTPQQLRTAEKTNKIMRLSAQEHSQDSKNTIHHIQDEIMSPKKTIRGALVATSPVKTGSSTQEIDIVELSSDSEASDSGADDSSDEQQNNSYVPRTQSNVRNVISPVRDSTVGSTSATDTDTTRGTPLAQTSFSTAPSLSQTRMNNFMGILRQVQTNVQQKVAQISHSQPLVPPKPPADKDDEQLLRTTKSSSQGLGHVHKSTSLADPEGTNESTIPEGQRPTPLSHTSTSSAQLATEVPPLRWADTVEKVQLSPLNVAFTKTSSISEQTLQKIPVTSGLSTVPFTATRKQLAKEATSYPVFSASQPVSRSAASILIQPRRARSNSAIGGDEDSVTIRNSVEDDDQPLADFHATSDSHFEDAQRQSQPITDSEEREALDAASSLLEIWDVEKEALASK